MALGLIIPTLIYWQHESGLSFTEISTLQSIGILLLLIMEIPSSLLADRYSLRKTILLGLLALAAHGAALSMASSYQGFLVAQVFVSIGLAFLSGTEEAWLHKLSTEHSFSRELSRMQIADEIGTMVGMALSSFIIWKLSASFSYGIAGISAVIACILFASIHDSHHTSSTEYQDWREAFEKWSGKKTHIPLLCLLFFFLAIVAFRGEILFQSFFSEKGLILSALGTIYVLGKTGAIAGSYSTTRLLQIFSEKVLFTGLLILQGAAFLLLQGTSLIFGVAALMLFYFSENVLRNIQKTLILKWSPRHMHATVLSLQSFSSAVILMFIAPLVGWGIDHHFTTVLLVVCILKGLVSLSLSFLATRHVQQIGAMS